MASTFNSIITNSSGPNQFVLLDDATGYVVPALVAANAASYSQTGTVLTVTSTAHNMTATQNGKNVYLANATISTGVAPVGYSGNWFSGFTYINANSFSCTCTNSQSATGTILTNIASTALPITAILPAGSLGLNGLLEYELLTVNNNSAGAKSAGVTINGTGITATASTTNTNSYVRKAMKLTGSLTAKHLSPPQSVFGPTATTVATLNQSHALNVDATIGLTLSSAAASDWNSFESILITGRRYA